MPRHQDSRLRLHVLRSLGGVVLVVVPAAARQTGDVESAGVEPAVEALALVDEREVSEALRRTVAELFERYSAAVHARDPVALEAVLDLRGVHARSHALAPLDALAEPRLVMQFVERLRQDLVTTPELPWRDLTVRRAVIGKEPGHLVVTTRATRLDDEGRPSGAVFERWHVRKADDGWRIVDRIDLATGVALSWRAARGFAAVPEAPAWSLQVDVVLRGAESLRANDPAGVARALEALEGVELPTPLQATVALMRAQYALDAGRAEAALRWAEEARRLRPTVPAGLRLVARAHAERGNHEATLAALEGYAAELPLDADLCFVQGRALAALGRLDAAAAAFRNGLALDPQSVDNLLGLARAMGAEGEQDLRDRFRRLDDPASWFEPLVLELFATGDLDDVEALIGELRNIAPTDPNGDYYEATLLMQRGEVRAAADLLRAAFPKVPDPAELHFYVQQYVDACLLLGVPLEAYENAPDGPFVFDLLCSDFLAAERYEAIEELALRHELTYPDDPWLPYYRGEVLRSRGDLGSAALRFEEGLLNAAAREVREVYRWNLVRVRLEEGAVERAYAEVEPREETYRQMVLYSLEQGDAALLDAVVALRREDRPDDPGLAALAGVRAFWRGDYTGALETLATEREALAADDPLLAHVERAYILSALRTGALERAERAARASTRRDGDPLFEALVYAARGEHARCLEALADCLRLGYEPDTLYRDPDLGPALLADEAYAVFRARYPAPDELLQQRTETARSDQQPSQG